MKELFPKYLFRKILGGPQIYFNPWSCEIYKSIGSYWVKLNQPKVFVCYIGDQEMDSSLRNSENCALSKEPL